jgi:hypothetical protein
MSVFGGEADIAARPFLILKTRLRAITFCFEDFFTKLASTIPPRASENFAGAPYPIVQHSDEVQRAKKQRSASCAMPAG